MRFTISMDKRGADLNDRMDQVDQLLPPAKPQP